MKEILEALAAMGVIGELVNKAVCYLAATSRKLVKPVSVLIQSRSSGSDVEKTAVKIKKDAPAPKLPPGHIKLFNRVIEFYHKL